MGFTVDLPARARRWTRIEYERLTELGVFQPGERLELIDGVLVVQEPQSSRHAAAIRRVVDALRGAVGEAWQVDSQLPIALDPDSEPDVAVVARDPGAYRDAHPSRAALVIEIADTSYRIDHEHKASLYARAGIPEYWIVDLARECLEVHREPEPSPHAVYGWRYRGVATLSAPSAVAALVTPDRAIPVALLLP